MYTKQTAWQGAGQRSAQPWSSAAVAREYPPVVSRACMGLIRWMWATAGMLSSSLGEKSLRPLPLPSRNRLTAVVDKRLPRLYRDTRRCNVAWHGGFERKEGEGSPSRRHEKRWASPCPVGGACTSTSPPAIKSPPSSGRLSILGPMQSGYPRADGAPHLTSIPGNIPGFSPDHYELDLLGLPSLQAPFPLRETPARFLNQ